MKKKDSFTKVFGVSIILFFIPLLVPSCSEKYNIDSVDNLSLISPNGIQIVDNLNELHLIIERDILSKDGVLKKFEISKIEYVANLENGFCATVFYEIENGIRRNFILSRNVSFNLYGAAIKTLVSKSKGETTVRVTCTANASCSAEECFSQVVYDIEEGTLTYQCACADCILEVETID